MVAQRLSATAPRAGASRPANSNREQVPNTREIGYHAPVVTRDRLALLITSSALLLSWMSVPASPTTEAVAQRPPVASPASPALDRALELARDVSRETERLNQRGAVVPASRRAGRDPFSFAWRPSPAPRAPLRSAPLAASLAAAVADSSVPAVAGPSLRLIGIAERTGADGLTRSAVLAGASDVHIVSVGDQVIGRFAVLAVEAGAIELRDLRSDAAVRLVLAQ